MNTPASKPAAKRRVKVRTGRPAALANCRPAINRIATWIASRPRFVRALMCLGVAAVLSIDLVVLLFGALLNADPNKLNSRLFNASNLNYLLLFFMAIAGLAAVLAWLVAVDWLRSGRSAAASGSPGGVVAADRAAGSADQRRMERPDCAEPGTTMKLSMCGPVIASERQLRIGGKASLISLLALVVTLSACSSGPSIVTATPPATVRSTYSPPTLPPTWTPVPLVSDTPVPVISPTVKPTTPAQPTQEGTSRPPLVLSNAVFPASCDAFAVDNTLTSRNLVRGNDATVVWKPIPDANAYHLWLATSDGHYRYNTTVSGDRVIIPAQQFLGAGIYAWELVAYSDFNPICTHLTGILIVGNG